MTTAEGSYEGLSLRAKAEALSGGLLSEESTNAGADTQYEEESIENYEEEVQEEETELNTDEGTESADESEEAESEDEPEESEYIDTTSLTDKKVKVKVNGVEEEITLKEVLEGYSKGRDYTRKTMELAEQRRQYENQVQAVRQQEAQLGQYVDVMLNLAAADPILAKLNNQGYWQDLKSKDPTKYVIELQEAQEHQRKYQMLSQRQQEMQARQWQEVRQQNVQKLPEYIPEWRDEKTYEAERVDVAKFLLTTGYSQQEVDTAIDARAIKIARDAMMYQKMLKASKTADVKKRPATIKSVPPGKAPVQAGVKALKELETQIASERNLRRKAELITQLEKLRSSK